MASREKRPERKGATVREENRKEIVQKVGAIKTDALGEADGRGTGQVPGGPSPKGAATGSGTPSPSMGRVEDLRVPRGREGEFHPAILPRRRSASLDGADAICARYAAGVCTGAIFRFLDTVYGRFYSPKEHLPPHPGGGGRSKSLAGTAVGPRILRHLSRRNFPFASRGGTAKEPVYLALGILPDGRREVLGFWLLGADGESAANFEEVLTVKKVRVFVSDHLPG